MWWKMNVFFFFFLLFCYFLSWAYFLRYCNLLLTLTYDDNSIILLSMLNFLSILEFIIITFIIVALLLEFNILIIDSFEAFICSISNSFSQNNTTIHLISFVINYFHNLLTLYHSNCIFLQDAKKIVDITQKREANVCTILLGSYL